MPTSVIRKACARFGGLDLHSVSPLPPLAAAQWQKLATPVAIIIGSPPRKKCIDATPVARLKNAFSKIATPVRINCPSVVLGRCKLFTRNFKISRGSG